uniref:RNase H type-1 domain-containing protein n=1 Tax=Hordeum vulgare subsp. vulgare TaxID=112509 RepID=A0A8I6YT70_HORVV
MQISHFKKYASLCISHLKEACHVSSLFINGRPSDQWKRPPVGWNKLSVDDAYNMDARKAGAGMIFHDEDSIVLAPCHHLHTSNSPLEAELAACM